MQAIQFLITPAKKEFGNQKKKEKKKAIFTQGQKKNN